MAKGKTPRQSAQNAPRSDTAAIPEPKAEPTDAREQATVEALRRGIARVRAPLMTEGGNHNVYRWDPSFLDRFWDYARAIPHTPPPPRLSIPANAISITTRQALEAMDELLRWCDEAEAKAKRPPRVHGGKRRDSAAIILAALCAHHQYDGTSIGNWASVGVRELSNLTTPTSNDEKPVSPTTVTRWFNKNFQGGHSAYERQCADDLLLASLKRLNNEFTPEDMQDITEYETGAWEKDQLRDEDFERGDS